jgi:Flp pilus assembly protein TadD
MTDAADLLEALRKRHGARLPDRYQRFLESSEYSRYPEVVFEGFIRGPYHLDFDSEDLADPTELALGHGIDDADDIDWTGDYSNYLPLAGLHHPEATEPKMFLMFDVRGKHPVVLFDHEGWTLYPLAESLDRFLAELPKAVVDVSRGFRPDEEDGTAALIEEEEEKPKAKAKGKTKAAPAPTPLAPRLAKALSLYRAGDLDDSLALLEGLLAQHPKEPGVLSGLVAVLRDLNRPEDALNLLKQLIEIQGQTSELLSRKARLELKLGRPKDALASARRAEQLGKKDRIDRATALALAGLAQFRLGDHDQARALLTEALELEASVAIDLPELEEATSALDLIVEEEDLDAQLLAQDEGSDFDDDDDEEEPGEDEEGEGDSDEEDSDEDEDEDEEEEEKEDADTDAVDADDDDDDDDDEEEEEDD